MTAIDNEDATQEAAPKDAAVEETKPQIRCNFCQKPTTEVKKMVAGPGVYICDKCVSLCVEIIGTELAKTSTDPDPDSAKLPERARWEERLSDDELLAALPGIASASAQVERELATWVRSARSRGITWTRIGGAMDMTRQSAWERFSGEE